MSQLDHARMVSIGLPVYNGEEFVESAVKALVSQTHAPLEIVISDNASIDRTWEILRAFEADPRVRLYRSESNLGAVANFNRAFRLTRGPYFAWAAADDAFHPDFAARCLEVLERTPCAAGCITGIRFVNEEGRELRRWVPGPEAASSDLRRRLRWYLRLHRWTESYALFRRPTIERSGGFPTAFGPDVLLVWRVLLESPMAIAPEPLLTYREKTNQSIADQAASLVAEATTRRPHFNNLNMIRDMWAIAGDMTARTRRTARQELILCLCRKTWRRRAMEDLSVELHYQEAQAARAAPGLQLWRRKVGLGGVYLVMACIEPGVFIRAGLRHALRRHQRESL